jgi:hypothetical protein
MTIDSSKTSEEPRRSRRGPSPAARRFGYAVAAVVDVLLLYLVNVWPGWQILPFLTGGMVEVLPWINASLAAGIVVSLIDVIFDRRWLRALGDLITTSIGLVALVQLWRVFPFDFGDTTVPWEWLARAVLIIGMIGSAIGIVVQAVILVRALVRR